MTEPSKPTIPPPQFFSVTGVQVTGTSWQCIVELRDMLPMGAEANEFPAAVAKLPWPLAKALQISLTNAIAQFEATDGQVLLPKSHQEKIDQKGKGAGS